MRVVSSERMNGKAANGRYFCMSSLVRKQRMEKNTQPICVLLRVLCG